MGDEFLRGLGADIQRAFNDAGVSTDGLQMLEFEALLDSERASRGVADAIARLGFTTKVNELEDDQWSCSCTAPLEIDVASLDGLGAKFQVIIEQDHKGQFNGWSLLARWDDLRNPKTPALSIGQIRGTGDTAKFPHTVVARVLDTTEPIDRGRKYDDRLDAALAKSGAGVLVMAGSHLQDRNVVALRFEFRMANVEGAVDELKRMLLECGAPRGSWLEVEGREVPLHDDDAELLARSRPSAAAPAVSPADVPASDWFAAEGESEGKPELWMMNGALMGLKAKASFPWHLSIICELKDTYDSGLPTPEENEVFKKVGQLFDDNITKGGNALALARITWDGTKQYVYRVRDPEIPHQWLQSIIAAKTELRPFEYEMQNDPAWQLAAPHLALAAQARKA